MVAGDTVMSCFAEEVDLSCPCFDSIVVVVVFVVVVVVVERHLYRTV